MVASHEGTSTCRGSCVLEGQAGCALKYPTDDPVAEVEVHERKMKGLMIEEQIFQNESQPSHCSCDHEDYALNDIQ